MIGHIQNETISFYKNINCTHNITAIKFLCKLLGNVYPSTRDEVAPPSIDTSTSTLSIYGETSIALNLSVGQRMLIQDDYILLGTDLIIQRIKKVSYSNNIRFIKHYHIIRWNCRISI